MRCLELSSDFSILVSGGADANVIVWNIRTKRMLCTLSKHNGPVISLSINPLSGQIVTLTSSQLRLYTVNGRLISFANIDSRESLHTNPERGGFSSLLTAAAPPRLVIATPTAEWQDGVVAVTGHEGGHVYLWRLHNLSSPKNVSLSELYPEDFDAAHYSFSASEAELESSPERLSIASQLYISSTPTKVHRSNITVLRLCSSAGSNTNRTKDLVAKSVEECGRAVDLLVGDADGFVSRWTPQRLDQLPTSDLHSIIMDNSY